MADGIGDRLARGDKSAVFVTSDGKITQKDWEERVGLPTLSNEKIKNERFDESTEVA